MSDNEKQQFLDEAAKVAGAPIESDLTALAEAWQELVEVANLTPNPGATDDEIAEFKTVTGYDMPEALASLLRLSNGAAEAFGIRDLMSVSAVIRQWSEWKGIFDDFGPDDLFDHYSSDQDRTLAMYTNPHWVAFGDEQTGNFAAVDLLPGPAGRKGQIIYFGADEHTIKCLAADLTDFLRREIAHVRTGDPDELWF